MKERVKKNERKSYLILHQWTWQVISLSYVPTGKFIYIIIHTKWVEPRMNIHEGKGQKEWEKIISDPTPVDLTSNFFVLCTNMNFIYIIIHSGWSLAWIFMKEWDKIISDSTPVDLTSNFFVLCTNRRVYLYNYAYWVEPSMNIHKGNGKKEWENNFFFYASLTACSSSEWAWYTMWT